MITADKALQPLLDIETIRELMRQFEKQYPGLMDVWRCTESARTGVPVDEIKRREAVGLVNNRMYLSGIACSKRYYKTRWFENLHYLIVELYMKREQIDEEVYGCMRDAACELQQASDWSPVNESEETRNTEHDRAMHCSEEAIRLVRSFCDAECKEKWFTFLCMETVRLYVHERLFAACTYAMMKDAMVELI